MGIEISIEWLTFAMFGSLLVFLMAGLPLAFMTGGLGVIFLVVFGDLNMVHMLPSRIFPFMTNYQLSALPLFLFMAAILERAGLIDALFDVVYKCLGGLKGGLASAAVIASTILAAMVGVIGATEVTMAMIALPAMLIRKYNPELACGSILAGGSLGILIPPSVMAILVALVLGRSIGELFVGAVFPGLLLAFLYIVYITARCYMNPSFGPALPPEERLSTREKLKLIRSIIAPLSLVALVLGVIFTGAATPVEAAGIGTFGALFVMGLSRRLTWHAIREAAEMTLRYTIMVLWIIFGASIFVGFYIFQGGADFVNNVLLGTGLPPYGILLVMMVLLIILGMFLDWVGIMFLALPIFAPIVNGLAWDGILGLPGVAPGEVLIWFGVVYMVNMQMSFLSPPFGYALFYLKSVAGSTIPMSTIYRAAIPFLGLQAVALFICVAFPEVILWLPRLIYGQ